MFDVIAFFFLIIHQISILSTDPSSKDHLGEHGKMEHDFEIIGTNVHVHAKPGKKGSTVFSLDQP
jgi:hypothetical protein